MTELSSTSCCASDTHGTTRRNLLRAGGAVLGAAGALTLGQPAAHAASKATPSSGLPAGKDWSGMNVVLLGTCGGPLPIIDRNMTSQAVVIDGSAYLVDCGSGVVNQYYAAGLTHSMLRGLFITHFHADHFSDYLPLILFGRPLPGLTYGYSSPLQVYGPPSFGLPPGTPASGVSLVNPENPHPGMVEMHHGLLKGAATTINSQYIQSRMGPDIRNLVEPHNISIPVSPRLDVPPTISPYTVFEDDKVRISATLVTHYWPFPSFGFRFDSEYGSVTFSGDTAPSENLVRLARNSDLLVHEVMDGEGMLEHGTDEALVRGLRSCHTDVNEVGKVASNAGAESLVLSHIVPQSLATPSPPKPPAGRWRSTINLAYDGKVIIGEDLDRLDVNTANR